MLKEEKTEKGAHYIVRSFLLQYCKLQANWEICIETVYYP